MIESTLEALERVKDVKKPEEVAKAYHAQLVHVMDMAGRIANDNGGALGNGGGVSRLEAEVLQLRRELASAKMEVARLAGANDELDHVVRRLNKQLVSVGSSAHR